MHYHDSDDLPNILENIICDIKKNLVYYFMNILETFQIHFPSLLFYVLITVSNFPCLRILCLRDIYSAKTSLSNFRTATKLYNAVRSHVRSQQN